jgi:pimeloyl-ACP methyl ester carboxylesterase
MTRVWRAALAGLLGNGRFGGLPDDRVPALLLWGDRDAIFPRTEQEVLRTASWQGRAQASRRGSPSSWVPSHLSKPFSTSSSG